MSLIAITRAVGPAIAHCELSHLERQPIALDRAQDQHAEYERILAKLGCRVISLPACDDFPDSVFVEDVAVVLDELAVITRPGAPSRRGEAASIKGVLKKFRTVTTIKPPATLDGGDVLVVGRIVFAGLTDRTSRDGIEQLHDVVAPLGYDVRAVRVSGCLHLKSAVTRIAPEMVVLNPLFVDPGDFDDLDCIEVAPTEAAAANALLVDRMVLLPKGNPATRDRIAAAGIEVIEVDNTEFARAEGGLTCCSLIFRQAAGR